MRKILVLMLLLCTAFFGCREEQEEKVDLSAYDFVGVEWTRDTPYCTETLCFRDDGTCSYYCGCGEPVNDDDLCEGYRYDPETKIISLVFSDPAEETVTQITIISCDEQTLVLDFGGEERIFENAETEEVQLDELHFDGDTYRYLEFPGGVFYYDLRESVDYEEDTVLPIPHDRWDLVYRDGDLFVSISQWDEAVACYADDENYTWAVFVYDPETEEPHVVPIIVSDEERSFLYGMDDMEKDTTLLFDGIELFGSLVKTHKDGLISATTSLAYSEGGWYWRSEIIDDSVEGWPEYVIRLPESITKQIAP